MNYFSVKNLLWFLVIASLAAIIFLSTVSIVPKDKHNQTESEKPMVSVLWKETAGEYLHWAFAEGGDYYTVVEPGGRISLHHYSGAKVFETVVKGADHAISTSNGAMTMAYNHLNPFNTVVTFLDAKGKQLSSMDVGGAIWSADSWARGDQCRFAVGTGRRQVYCIIYEDSGRRYNRWRAPGVVVSVSFEDNGDNLLYATWQKSFLLRSTRRGTVRWSTAIDPAALSEISCLGHGKRWRALIVPNRQGSDALLTMMSDDCKMLWEKTVEAKNRSRVLVSYSGRFCCIGYEKQIMHSGKAITEYRAKLLDSKGKLIWDKGSLFLRIKPLAVMDDGLVVSIAPDGKMHMVDARGNVYSAGKLGADVVNSIWSPQAGRILVECQDGKIYMLGLSSVKKE